MSNTALIAAVLLAADRIRGTIIDTQPDADNWHRVPLTPANAIAQAQELESLANVWQPRPSDISRAAQGGRARAAKLTPAQRSKIAKQGAAARWKGKK